MCPLAVATDGGRCFLMLEGVKFGQVMNWLFITASRRVLVTGLKAAACKKVRWSARRVCCCLCVRTFSCGFGWPRMGRVHSPFAWREPVRIVLVSVVIWTLVGSKVTLHPASQSVATDKSEFDVRFGKMCAFCAWMGSNGLSGKVVVCVDLMADPSGNRTRMGCMVGVCGSGQEAWRK